MNDNEIRNQRRHENGIYCGVNNFTVRRTVGVKLKKYFLLKNFLFSKTKNKRWVSSFTFLLLSFSYILA